MKNSITHSPTFASLRMSPRLLLLTTFIAANLASCNEMERWKYEVVSCKSMHFKDAAAGVDALAHIGTNKNLLTYFEDFAGPQDTIFLIRAKGGRWWIYTPGWFSKVHLEEGSTITDEEIQQACVPHARDAGSNNPRVDCFNVITPEEIEIKPQ